MAVIEWAKIMEKSDWRLHNLYHVPNEGKRSRAEGGRLKRMGLRSGVPDLILDYPAGAYHGLRIEMKVGSNRTTQEQKDCLWSLFDAGYFVAVCYSAAAAIELIVKYLNLPAGSRIEQSPGQVWGRK